MMELINLLLRKKNLFKLIWFLALGSAKNLFFNFYPVLFGYFKKLLYYCNVKVKQIGG